MAYKDQSARTSQRAATITAVALLQGAAIIAIVNGLAVKFVARPPDQRTSGEQIWIQPPAPPPTPSDARPKDSVEPQVEPTITRPTTDSGLVKPPYNPPEPMPPSGSGGGMQGVELPQPPPLAPSVPPRGASPRTDPRGWVTPDDYTPRDIREGNSGTVGFTLRIGADGKVQACTVTHSSGFASLDNATCRLIARRARFRPSSDGNGNPAVGEYSNNVRWVIPE